MAPIVRDTIALTIALIVGAAEVEIKLAVARFRHCGRIFRL